MEGTQGIADGISFKGSKHNLKLDCGGGGTTLETNFKQKLWNHTSSETSCMVCEYFNKAVFKNQQNRMTKDTNLTGDYQNILRAMVQYIPVVGCLPRMVKKMFRV